MDVGALILILEAALKSAHINLKNLLKQEERFCCCLFVLIPLDFETGPC